MKKILQFFIFTIFILFMNGYLAAQPPCNLSVNIIVDSSACPAYNLYTQISGGTQPVTYYWITGSTSQNIFQVSPGTYAVYVTDGNGCNAGDTVVLAPCSQSCNVAATIQFTPTTCPTSSDGSATVYYTGFSSTPNILWSNGAITQTINNIPSGYYLAQVFDSLCSTTATVYVPSNAFGGLFLSTFSSTGNSCQPDSLQAYFSGAQGVVTFSWSNGVTTQSSTGMGIQPINGPGIYSVTAEYGGCTYVDSIMIGGPMSATYNTINASCANGDGAINLTISGGVQPYYYSWSNGSNSEDQSNLNAGTYSVTIYDQNQCQVVQNNIVIGGGGNVFLNPIINQANCADSLGMIYLSGAQQYQILWSNGSTSYSLLNLSSGWYSVTITGPSCTVVRNYFVPRDSSCDVTISGYVYNVSLSNACSGNGAYLMPNVMVRLQPLGLLTFTNANGYYSFNVPNPGNYSVEYVLNNPAHSVLCPANNSIAVNNTQPGGFYGSNNFYITSPLSQDVSIELGHYSTVTPGFGYWTYATFCNDGQLPASGTITMSYDPALDFDVIWSMSSIGTPIFNGHNASLHELYFSYSNLQPGQCGYLYVDFNTPTSLALGTSVVNSINITPLNGDPTPTNNTDSDATVCVGSWDPNEKLASPVRTGNSRDGGDIYEIDEIINYTIHFQNLGTAPAYRVVIRDTLESNLLIETIRNVGFSHNATLSVENGNVLVVSFDNINLPHAGFDERGSNGFVKFTINRVAGLTQGTVINNDASIYFDFNTPIETNNVPLTITYPVATEKLEAFELNTKVYPNPFNNNIQLSYQLKEDSNVSLSVYNALGVKIKDLQAEVLENAGLHLHQFNLEDLSTGLFYLNIKTERGTKIEKIIKR